MAQFHAAERRYELLHQEAPFHDGTFESWAEKPSLSHPFRYDDGVRIWLSRFDLSPEDDFLEQSVAKEISGDQAEPGDSEE